MFSFQLFYKEKQLTDRPEG